MNPKTLALAIQLAECLSKQAPEETTTKTPASTHPMLGKRVLVRTYSAGVHIGTLDYVSPGNSMELKLKDSVRLWSWKDGGLSLYAIANKGVVSGRLDKTGEVYLTNAIEVIPTTKEAEETYVRFTEK